MVNGALLKAEIEDLGVKMNKLAKNCDVTERTLSNWIDNPHVITCVNAKKLSDSLRLSDEKRLLIFFADDVQ